MNCLLCNNLMESSSLSFFFYCRNHPSRVSYFRSSSGRSWSVDYFTNKNEEYAIKYGRTHMSKNYFYVEKFTWHNREKRNYTVSRILILDHHLPEITPENADRKIKNLMAFI